MFNLVYIHKLSKDRTQLIYLSSLRKLESSICNINPVLNYIFQNYSKYYSNIVINFNSFKIIIKKLIYFIYYLLNSKQ